jgi:hypothetical protein
MSSADTTCAGGISGTTPASHDINTDNQLASFADRIENRYIADHVYALPTIAFFLSALGLFVFGHLTSQLLLRPGQSRGSRIWWRLVAAIRYLSYRVFRVQTIQWNSAPLGILLLGAGGTIFFFCMIIQTWSWLE